MNVFPGDHSSSTKRIATACCAPSRDRNTTSMPTQQNATASTIVMKSR